MALVGITEDQIMANPPGAGIWISNLIATAVPVYFMAWLFTKLNVESAMRGLLLGLGISFSFQFLTQMTQNLFAMRPYELTWVSGGFNLVALALVGLILGGWRKYQESK